VDSAALTDAGRVRSRNEDSYLLQPPIFAVADGMGGHAAGQKASYIAAHVLLKEYEANKCTGRAVEEWLPTAAQQANRTIRRFASFFPALKGMGTTVTAAVIENDNLLWTHIGDSRLYLYRDGNLQQITKDHRLVQELADRGIIDAAEVEDHPQRNILTRALGTEAQVKADFGQLQMLKGDKFLLCTDGLTAVVAEDRIQARLAEGNNAQTSVQELLTDALTAGAPDNVTVMVVCV